MPPASAIGALRPLPPRLPPHSRGLEFSVQTRSLLWMMTSALWITITCILRASPPRQFSTDAAIIGEYSPPDKFLTSQTGQTALQWLLLLPSPRRFPKEVTRP